jgi:hypothetical protein
MEALVLAHSVKDKLVGRAVEFIRAPDIHKCDIIFSEERDQVLPAETN